MSNSQWLYASQPDDAVRALAQSAQVSPLLAKLLINRGIDTPKAAKAFLHPQLTAQPSHRDFPNIDKAVERILLAIKEDQEISIQGDYDADGTCGTAILSRLFKMLNAKHSCHLPSRKGDGYGLSVNAINAAKERGVGVIITVDNGIAAVEEIAHAQDVGIDVIVTDHHRFGDVLPPAFALLHPGLPDSTYPTKNLCGTGVAFKLAFAIADAVGERLSTRPDFANYLNDCLALVAIASVADVVPLTGENRALTKAGLSAIEATNNVALQQLKRVSRVDGAVTSTDIGFRLAPRLNAAGRMGEEMVALELLLAEDEIEASRLAEELETLNKARQKIERETTKQCIAQIEADSSIADAPVLVVAGEDWPLGVLGICASRLARKFDKPAIVMGIGEDGIAKGSGRSASGFDLYHALEACDQLLMRFGGHKQAAGLTIEGEKIPAFRKMMSEVAPKFFDFQPATTMLKLDAIVTPQDLTTQLADDVAALEPFGQGNPEPLLALESGDVLGTPRLVGKTSAHLSFFVRLGQSAGFKAIGFSMADDLATVEAGKVNLAFVPKINDFQGRHDLELEVKAIRAGR